MKVDFDIAVYIDREGAVYAEVLHSEYPNALVLTADQIEDVTLSVNEALIRITS